MSWILSFSTCKKYFSKTILYTDDFGANILVDKLNIKFDTVCTDLNKLDNENSRWWAAGKLLTYSKQSEPFIHFDNDVFLWKPFEPELMDACIIAQNRECFEVGKSWYHPEKYDVVLKLGGVIPNEMLWYKNLSKFQYAVCCGVFGGNNLSFIRNYSNKALEIIFNNTNSRVWSLFGEDNILVEQYFLAAMIEYHKKHENSFNIKKVSYLFESSDQAFNPDFARKLGFTHLIGGAKTNNHFIPRLEKRVCSFYPNIMGSINYVADYIRSNLGVSSEE